MSSARKLFLFFSIVFILIFVLSPSSSFATFAGGDGSLGNPYQVNTCDNLQEIEDDVTAHYVLISDINCSASSGWNSGEGFNPIGSISSMFTGSLDGQNHSVTNLFIDRPGLTYVGLFAAIGTGGDVSNIGLEDVDITGGVAVGGLAGATIANIDNAYASGSVTGGTAGGVLIGISQATVSNSYSEGNVSAPNAGGLIGMSISASIVRSYSSANVSDGAQSAGGLTAQNSGTVSNSYATGSVTGVTNVGGLIGTYAAGTITNSFWNTETSGQNTSAGGTGKTTEEMKDMATFFDASWDIQTTSTNLNNGYPFLSWQTGDSSPIWYISGGSGPSPTPSPSPSGGGTSGSGGSSSSGSSIPTCVTGSESAPDLFQINTTKNTAELLFVPVGKTANYVISYGFSQEANQFSVMTNSGESSGAISYTVNALPENSTMYFKIYAQNDCAQGYWGNTINVVTNGKTYYKSILTQALSLLP